MDSLKKKLWAVHEGQVRGCNIATILFGGLDNAGIYTPSTPQILQRW